LVGGSGGSGRSTLSAKPIQRFAVWLVVKKLKRQKRIGLGHKKE
jgi:hypothetical protein